MAMMVHTVVMHHPHRFQRLLFPGLAATAPPAYKNRAVAFVISNQNQFCQASLGWEMGASGGCDLTTTVCIASLLYASHHHSVCIASLLYASMLTRIASPLYAPSSHHPPHHCMHHQN
jgi:hypothetical protein